MSKLKVTKYLIYDSLENRWQAPVDSVSEKTDSVFFTKKITRFSILLTQFSLHYPLPIKMLSTSLPFPLLFYNILNFIVQFSTPLLLHFILYTDSNHIFYRWMSRIVY